MRCRIARGLQPQRQARSNHVPKNINVFPLDTEFEELNEICVGLTWSGENSLGERQNSVEPCIRTGDVHVQYVIQQWNYTLRAH